MAVLNSTVHLQRDEAGYGIAFGLIDGGTCCGITGPHFIVDGGQLVFPAQKYVLPAGIPVNISTSGTSTNAATPWPLNVETLTSAGTAEVASAFRFAPVHAEPSEDSSPQPIAYILGVSLTRKTE